MRTIPELAEGTHRAKATGTLPNGKPVVVNSDGTVSVADNSSVPQSIGTAATVNTGTSGDISAIYDSANNKVVVFYRDESNSNYGTASVGTINGTSLSFGSEVVFSSEYVGYVNSVYDVAAGKAVVFYSNTSAHGRCNVGTVSGTSISFGSQVTVTENTTYAQTSAYDPVNQKIVLAMQKASSGECLVCTVSGSSLSTGTEVTFDSQTVTLYVGGLAYNPATGKFVLAYRERGANNYGEAIVGTVSGTSISFGAIEGFNSSNTQNIVVSSDPTSNHVVIYYKDTGNSQNGEAKVGTITGTSIGVGSLTQYSAGEVGRQSAVYNVAAGKHVVFFSDQSDNTKGFFCEGTVSGTSVSFTSPVEYEAGTTVWSTGAAYISDEKVVVHAFADNSDSGKGKAIVIRSAYSSTNLTAENYIGMSQGVVGKLETQPEAIGTPVTYYTTAATAYTSATFDSNSNKVVVSFRGQGDDGTSVVGTVNSSNNSISFGSPEIWNTNESIYIRSAFDSNSNKVVVVYRDEGNFSQGTAVVGTVSGTSISFGTPVVFSGGGAVDHIDVTFDISNSKVVIAYRNRTANFQGKAIVGTVSGTSISFGSEVTFNTVTNNIYMNTAFDSNSNKVVVGWANPGKAKVGTVSGTSISFGSEATFSSGNLDHFSSAFDSSNNKVVYAYRDEGNSNYGTAVVGTVSGTSISFGTPVVFESATVDTTATTFDSNANKVNIFYEDVGNSAYGTVIVGTVSGTSISFGSPTVFQTSTTGAFAAAFDSDSNRAIGAYANEGSSSDGTAVVFRNAGEYPITGQVNAGSSATVDIIGSVSTNQLGLTAGQSYYVQTDGTIGETAADPSVFAGTAISATSLVVKT